MVGVDLFADDLVRARRRRWIAWFSSDKIDSGPDALLKTGRDRFPVSVFIIPPLPCTSGTAGVHRYCSSFNIKAGRNELTASAPRRKK
jgi:hypothetical protein